MNDKCKYCDYVSKCSRICEYNSILCRAQRSFPKVVDKSYEQLQQENQQLKDNWNELRKWIVYNKHNENTEQHYLVVDYGTLLGKMIKLEQGSDSNE
ncbi:MAG: hypothetical protein V8Q71_00135 [Bacilli bacterium]